MEHPGECYYKLNRFILSVAGLWPYQNKWSARLGRAIIVIVMLSSVIFQISSVFTSDITADFIVDIIPALVPTLGSLSHLYAHIRQEDKLRDLLEHIWNDWRLQKTRYEIKVMREHVEITRLLALYYLLLQYSAVILYLTWLFMPDILDIISPMNESHPRLLPFKAEFFVDEKRYFNLIRSHTCCVIVVFPLIFLLNSTLFLALTQHACGMCELMGFIDMIEIYHTIPFLMDLLGLVLVLSLALTQMLTIAGNVERAVRSTGVAIVSMLNLFLSNYMGQRVTDMSSSACEKVYNSAWYNADVSEQKLLMLIIKRRFHPLILTACRFYVMSVPNFGRILQSAMSYCMFMRQF